MAPDMVHKHSTRLLTQKTPTLPAVLPRIVRVCCRRPQDISDLAFACSALPELDLPPIATKPFKPNAFLAACTASVQALRPLFAKAFFAAAEAFLDTILPALFFVNCACV